MTLHVIVPIATVVTFIAVAGAIGLIAYVTRHLTRDDEYDDVSLDVLLSDADARDRALASYARRKTTQDDVRGRQPTTTVDR